MSDFREPPPDRSIEVCREFTRDRCKRSDAECRYAHPPSHVEVQNGRVTCCFDSIKGRCQRDKCRYMHPPPHLADQILRGGSGRSRSDSDRPSRESNGRSMSSSYRSMGGSMGGGIGSMGGGMGDVGNFNPYLADALASYKAAFEQLASSNSSTSWGMGPGGSSYGGGGSSYGGGGSSYGGGGGGLSERRTQETIEVCREFLRGKCSRQETECRYAHPPPRLNVVDNSVTICLDFLKGRCSRESCRYFHPPEHLQARLKYGGTSSAGSSGRKRSYNDSMGTGNGWSASKRPATNDD